MNQTLLDLSLALYRLCLDGERVRISDSQHAMLRKALIGPDREILIQEMQRYNCWTPRGEAERHCWMRRATPNEPSLYQIYLACCAVKAENMHDFLLQYYKSERYAGRGRDYMHTCQENALADLAEHGYTVISHHDSVTGREVAFFA